jgi:hypothetical protein
MEVEISLFTTKKGSIFSPNTQIGRGTIKGDTLDEIKKQAENLVENPEKGFSFFYGDIQKRPRLYDYKNNSFRIEFEVEGKKYNIKPKNNKSMSKKDFENPILNILNKKPEAPQNTEGEETATSQESPKKVGRPKKDRSQESENETEPRTYKLRNEILQKVKLVALKTGRTQTEVVEYALTELIDRYEKKNGILDVTEAQKSFEEFF